MRFIISSFFEGRISIIELDGKISNTMKGRNTTSKQRLDPNYLEAIESKSFLSGKF